MNERRKSLRDRYFDKYRAYFNTSYLEIKNRSIVYPTTDLQLRLPGIDSGSGLRVRLGRFFEILAQGIYGGKIGDFYEFNESNRENIRSEPDITDELEKPNILREVKATYIGNTLKLIDHQMEKYLDLQAGDTFSKPPIIRFEIFRHNVKDLLKISNEKGLEGIIKELTEETKAMISFPFSIMYKIYQANTPFTRRYEGEGKFYDLTTFSVKGLTYLLLEPEETLKKLEINPDSFEFTKKKFRLDVKINEIGVAPFPVLIINEKNPDEELEKLKDIYYSDVPF